MCGSYLVFGNASAAKSYCYSACDVNISYSRAQSQEPATNGAK